MDGITKIDAVTYSQNHEDWLIAGFFPDVKNGFYVDVGANDPKIDSVTKIFYDSGWHGINIEPIPRLYQMLCKDRPRDINLNIGASSKPGVTKFREYHEYHGLSTMSKTMIDEYKKNDTNLAYKDYEDYEVKLYTLADIFKEQKVSKIHFLKVDVEGYEYEVLFGNDWEVYRPELICIEANHLIQDWHPLLKANRYTYVLSDGINEYYLAEEALGRLKLFPFPKSLIAGSPVLAAQQKEKIRNLEWQVQHQKAEARVEVFQQAREFQSERYELHHRINLLSAEIETQRRLRKQVLGVLRATDRLIFAQIERIKVAAPPPYIYGSSSSDLTADDIKRPIPELLVTIRLLDNTNYYLQSIKQPLQLRNMVYMAVRKTYEFIRNIGKHSIVWLWRCLKKIRARRQHNEQ